MGGFEKRRSFRNKRKPKTMIAKRKSDSRDVASTEVFAFGANSDSQLANNAVDSSTATPLLIRSLPPSIVVQKVRLLQVPEAMFRHLTPCADIMWCCTRIVAFQ
jgi:hypothetical protein